MRHRFSDAVQADHLRYAVPTKQNLLEVYRWDWQCKKGSIRGAQVSVRRCYLLAERSYHSCRRRLQPHRQPLPNLVFVVLGRYGYDIFLGIQALHIRTMIRTYTFLVSHRRDVSNVYEYFIADMFSLRVLQFVMLSCCTAMLTFFLLTSIPGIGYSFFQPHFFFSLSTLRLFLFLRRRRDVFFLYLNVEMFPFYPSTFGSLLCVLSVEIFSTARYGRARSLSDVFTCDWDGGGVGAVAPIRYSCTKPCKGWH